MVPADRGNKPRQGKRQGQVAKRPDPPSSGDYHAGQDNGETIETQAFKAGTLAGRGSTCDLDGPAKPAQHGHRICRLGRRSARAAGRPAFLTAKRRSISLATHSGTG
jgi:hypothetical protein